MVNGDQNEQSGEGLAAVAASEYRRKVVERLTTGSATPSTIAEDTGHKIAHVSRALSRLREVGVAELLVPEETKKGRVYALTDHGRDVAEQVGLDAAGEGDGD